MERIFTKNMFIMLLSIMIGAIIITYFIADLQGNMKIDEINLEHETQISNLQSKNINFTNNFLKSLVVLDQAREARALANYHYDLAFLWYENSLKDTNISDLNEHKNYTISNCTIAMPEYQKSHNNFKIAQEKFRTTKDFTDYPSYIEVLDIYDNLTESGARLTMLKYNATQIIKQLVEKITIKIINNTAVAAFAIDVSELLEQLDMTLEMIIAEFGSFESFQEMIDEYEFFDEIR